MRGGLELVKGQGWRQQRLRQVRRNLARAYPDAADYQAKQVHRTMLAMRIARYAWLVLGVIGLAGAVALRCSL
jgi:lauroyl/myristoyl acyltransferase